MSLVVACNNAVAVGEHNAMFSGIEVVPSQLDVDPKQKLTTTWGALKGRHQD